MLGERRRFNYLMEDYQKKNKNENIPPPHMEDSKKM